MNPLTIGFVDELLKIASSTDTPPVLSPEKQSNKPPATLAYNMIDKLESSGAGERIQEHNKKVFGEELTHTRGLNMMRDIEKNLKSVTSPREAADLVNKSFLASSLGGYKDRTTMQKVLDHFRFSEDPYIKSTGTPGQADFSARMVYPGHGKKYLAGLGGAAAGALAYKLLKNRKKKKRDE